MLCPRCSQNLPDGARFCPACGQEIEAIPPAVTQPVPQPAQPQQPAAAPQVPAQPQPAQPAAPAQPQQPVAPEQPQTSGFYPTDGAVPPAPAAAPAQPVAGKPKKKSSKLVAIVVAVLAFVIASQAGQFMAGSFLEDEGSSTEIAESDSEFETPESPDLDEVLEPPTSDINFDDTYSFGGLSIPVDSSWEPDSTTDEAGDVVCYFLPFGTNEICLQQIDTGVTLSDEEVAEYNELFIDGLAESDLQLQNGTCYPIEEDGKTVLEWDGSYDLDGEEYGVYGKTYFIGTDMIVASYSYPLSDADNGFSRAVSFLERVKVA